jgi:hypothetical protein
LFFSCVFLFVKLSFFPKELPPIPDLRDHPDFDGFFFPAKPGGEEEKSIKQETERFGKSQIYADKLEKNQKIRKIEEGEERDRSKETGKLDSRKIEEADERKRPKETEKGNDREVGAHSKEFLYSLAGGCATELDIYFIFRNMEIETKR